MSACEDDLEADIRKFAEVVPTITLDSLTIAYSQVNSVLKYVPMEPPHYYNYISKSDPSKKYLPCDEDDSTHQYFTLKGLEFACNEFYIELLICPEPSEKDVMQVLNPIVKSFKKRTSKEWIVNDDRIFGYSSGQFYVYPLYNEVLQPDSNRRILYKKCP